MRYAQVAKVPPKRKANAISLKSPIFTAIKQQKSRDLLFASSAQSEQHASRNAKT